MKITHILVTIFLALITTSCHGQSTRQDKSVVSTSISKIQVLNFHSTHRCVTCKRITKNTEHVLRTNFAEQVNAGVITFSKLNVDQKLNEQIAEKYKAFGTALFLSVTSKGEETIINLTDLAYMKSKNLKVYTRALSEIIRQQLERL